jgi:CubicO group peptidase (beta-lactamase class C family)
MALIPTRDLRRKRALSAIKTVVAAGLILALAGPVAAAADEKTDRVDKLFAAWDKTTSPGAALAVIKDGRIVYERGYGMAKIEGGIVNTPDKVFDIGSVSKQFTAACVALLVREGKIGLDNDIRKYLPELPAYGKPVTVRHLLHHTSGLRDYNALLSLAGFRPESDSPTVEEALEIVRRQKKLNYTPGEEYSYTNTGYFLLSQIVERVSGKSLNAFARERIFEPLGMSQTLIQDDHTQIIRDRATGYTRGEKGFAISMSNWDETGDGNVYTTVRDMAKWDQAFYTGAALGKDLVEMMQTTGTLNSGKKIDYAWGLVVTEYKGLKVVEHGGAWVGFRAALVRFPEQRFSAIVLANLDAMDPAGLAFKVADIYLAGQLKEPAKEEAGKTGVGAAQGGAAQGGVVQVGQNAAGPGTTVTPTVTKAEMEALVGNWQDDRFGLWLTVTLKDEKLYAGLNGRTYILAPVGPEKYVVPGNAAGIAIEFAAGQKGKPATAHMTVGKSQEFRFEKAAEVKALWAADLAACAGTYVSEELLDAKYKLSVEEGGLVLKTRAVARAELKPMAPDKFVVPGYGLTVEFVRGRSGAVTGFTVSVGRAAGIAFARAGSL